MHTTVLFVRPAALLASKIQESTLAISAFIRLFIRNQKTSLQFMSKRFILALDQGTTSSRAILFNHEGNIEAVEQQEYRQYFPDDGWVEQDPDEIWNSQSAVIAQILAKNDIKEDEIAAAGITNQRETTIIWDRESGQPVYNAIVWQDKRTAAWCDELRRDGFEDIIRQKTGLLLDPYFSASKIRWILNNVSGAREKAEAGKLAFGTVDSWLVWKLTGGKKHITDVSNASRTMLFNIHTLKWDKKLLKLFDIPESLLPEVRSSSEVYAETSSGLFKKPLPIAGIAGDQQAALFGQLCTEPGMLKNTYGTGSFIMFNLGEKPVLSQNKLLTTIAWQIDGKTTYALEGSVFIAGALIKWLRDGLGIIRSSSQVEALALSVPDNGGVYLVPAFNGLGAPHWDPHARGIIAGLTQNTQKGHIARAAQEAVAYQTADVLEAMQKDAGIEIRELRVDGGASVNNTLMQFQADILGLSVDRPEIIETTALGAAYLAGLAVGFWKDISEINTYRKTEHRFEPAMDASAVKHLLKKWRQAVERSKNWAE